MTYWMFALHDGNENAVISYKGDSGTMSVAYLTENVDGIRKYVRDEEDQIVKTGDYPQLDCVMRVGSSFARTMEHQDYWTTTPIIEIVEEHEDEEEAVVIFKTSNSTYKWKRRKSHTKLGNEPMAIINTKSAVPNELTA